MTTAMGFRQSLTFVLPRRETDSLRDRLTRAEPMTDFYRRLAAARAARAA